LRINEETTVDLRSAAARMTAHERRLLVPAGPQMRSIIPEGRETAFATLICCWLESLLLAVGVPGGISVLARLFSRFIPASVRGSVAQHFLPTLLVKVVGPDRAQYRNGDDTCFHATVGKMYPRQLRSYRKPTRNMRQRPLPSGEL
jgi:hypothetical protein